VYNQDLNSTSSLSNSELNKTNNEPLKPIWQMSLIKFLKQVFQVQWLKGSLSYEFANQICFILVIEATFLILKLLSSCQLFWCAGQPWVWDLTHFWRNWSDQARMTHFWRNWSDWLMLTDQARMMGHRDWCWNNTKQCRSIARLGSDQ
jgi:hypothetical protein